MSVDRVVTEFEVKRGEVIICKTCKTAVEGPDVAILEVINGWIVNHFCSPTCCDKDNY